MEGTGPDTGGPMPAAEAARGAGVRDLPSAPDRPDARRPRPPPEPPAAAPPPPAAPPPAPAPAAPAPSEPTPAASAPAPATAAPTPPLPPDATPTELPRAATPPPRPAAPDPAARPRGSPPDGPPRACRWLSAVAALLIVLLAEGIDRWNLFAVLSPIEAVGVAVATWLIARSLRRRSHRHLARRRLAARLRRPRGRRGARRCCASRATASTGSSTLLAVIVLLGALATLAAGVGCLRALDRPNPARRPSTRARSCSGSPAPGSPRWRCSSTTTGSARCGTS